jgi:hypothetical protein
MYSTTVERRLTDMDNKAKSNAETANKKAERTEFADEINMNQTKNNSANNCK